MSDLESLSYFIDEAIDSLLAWEQRCLILEKGENQESLAEIFRAAHNLKGSSRTLGLENYGSFVHEVEELLTQLKNGQLGLNSEIISVLFEVQSFLLDWTHQLKEQPHLSPATEKLLTKIRLVSGANPTPLDADGKMDLGSILIQKGHVTHDQIEYAVSQQNRKLGEILIEEGLVNQKVLATALEEQKAVGHKNEESIRVNLKKLDALMRLVGELSIHQSMISLAKHAGELDKPLAQKAIELSAKTVLDLQNEVLALRMQTLENLFQRMERVARDVAKSQNKDIRVELQGIGVELDKVVIEKIKDPLVHILRNAVDHGIENKELRLAAGKNPQATITLEGSQTASHVLIKISDDGGGLKTSKILQKAIASGLVSADQRLSHKEIHELIFRPGFSTNDEVSQISGRGVGMDVVKQAVDDLHGSVHIVSLEGKGTTFEITLPASVAILDALVVKVAGSRYVIPLQDVDEVLSLSDLTVENHTNEGRMISVRGETLPIEKMENYLKVKNLQRAVPNQIAVLYKHEDKRMAFEIEGIDSQQSIVVRKLEGHMAKLPGLSGATILPNGEAGMILHLETFFHRYQSQIREQNHENRNNA